MLRHAPKEYPKYILPAGASKDPAYRVRDNSRAALRRLRSSLLSRQPQ